MPDTFVELDGEADDLVVAQSPLLLLQNLTTVLVGAVGDCGRRELGRLSLGAGRGTLHQPRDLRAQCSEPSLPQPWAGRQRSAAHWPSMPLALVPGGGLHVRTHVNTLTFCQGVGCIEIPPPFHLIWKRGSRLRGSNRLGSEGWWQGDKG